MCTKPKISIEYQANGSHFSENVLLKFLHSVQCHFEHEHAERVSALPKWEYKKKKKQEKEEEEEAEEVMEQKRVEHLKSFGRNF